MLFVFRRSPVILAASSGGMIETNNSSTLLRFMSLWVYSLAVTYWKVTKMAIDLHNYIDTCV